MNRLQQEYMRLSKKLETKQPQHQVRKGNSARFGKCRMARWLEEDGKKCVATIKVCFIWTGMSDFPGLSYLEEQEGLSH